MQERPTNEEPRWHAALGVLFALLLYVKLPPKLSFGPLWLMPVLVLLLLVPLMIFKPRRHAESKWQRIASIAHIAFLNLFNVASVVLLVRSLLAGHGAHMREMSGGELLLAAVQIWLTNVIVFALWYWEVDGHGPDARANAAFAQVHRRADFLFPQMALGPDVQKRYGFRPQFWDYVYLAFNTATAFSPADTFPLTPLGKALMMAESSISLVTIAIIAGRAVNILNGS